MQASSQSRAVFVSGLLIGLAVALGSMLVLRDKGEPKAAPPVPAAAKASTVRTDVLGAAAAPKSDAQDAASCGSSLLVSRGGRDDGSVNLDPAPPKALPGQVAGLLLQGKEAVASGRPRDAEALFRNGCRTAAADTGPDAAIGSADARYRLARLYAQAAARMPAAKRSALLTQARALYSDSLRTYTERLGDKSDKTRYAAKGLAALGTLPAQATAVAQAQPEAKPKPKPRPQPQSPVQQAQDKPLAQAKAPPKAPDKPSPQAVAKAPPAAKAPPPEAVPAPAPEAPAVAAARQQQPSFDCRRARSTSEKIICSDPDLARQDRELGRIYARAKEAAPDPRAFQRDSDAQWQQRESHCRDRECLQRWYAQRREALQSATALPSSEPPAQASGDAGVH